MDSAKFNIIFVIFSCLAAHFLPFELILGAYAFLGPAHYLTEISWLHDKDYFLGNHWVAILLGVGTLLVIFFPAHWDFYIWGSILLCLALTASKKGFVRGIVIFFGAFFIYQFYEPVGIFSLILMSLLPTIIHVFLFTYFFIIAGYLKRRNPWDLLNLTLIPIAVFSFFSISTQYRIFFPNWVEQNIEEFQNITSSITEVFGFKPTLKNSIAISKFVSFAYTFHYLNWFSKTRMLGWHRMSILRTGVLIILYVIFVGIYLYNYQTGLKALFFLSIYHVVLEFPLNFIIIKGILKLNPIRPPSSQEKD